MSKNVALYRVSEKNGTLWVDQKHRVNLCHSKTLKSGLIMLRCGNFSLLFLKWTKRSKIRKSSIYINHAKKFDTVFKIKQNSLCNCELKKLVSVFTMWLKKSFIFRELGYFRKIWGKIFCAKAFWKWFSKGTWSFSRTPR